MNGNSTLRSNFGKVFFAKEYTSLAEKAFPHEACKEFFEEFFTSRKLKKSIFRLE